MNAPFFVPTRDSDFAHVFFCSYLPVAVLRHSCFDQLLNNAAGNGRSCGENRIMRCSSQNLLDRPELFHVAELPG
jgi:hypothetical protein